MSVRTKVKDDMRQGLNMSLAISIKDALLLLETGRINDARLRLACAIEHANSLCDDIAGASALDPLRSMPNEATPYER